MLTKVTIQIVVLHAPKDNNDFETELATTNVLAHTSSLAEWAQQEIDEMHDYFFDLLADKPLGVYSIIQQFNLRGGKYADTPNGPGEYWSDCSPVWEPHIQALTKEDAEQYMESFSITEDDLTKLFGQIEPSFLKLL